VLYLPRDISAENEVGKLEKVARGLGGGLGGVRGVRGVVAGRVAEVRKEFGDEADAL